jgi:Spy/CpxP family protein refolding chaperone
MARTSPRALAALLLVVVGALGVAAGVALDRYVLNPPKPHISRYAPESAHRFARYLTKELTLSAAQQRTVDSILIARQAQSKAVADEVRPRFEAVTAATRADLDRVFTPAQRARYAELREQHRRERAERDRADSLRR